MTAPPGRVLLAHEWLEPTGGSENTFEQIRLACPGARCVSLWNNAPDRFPGAQETWLGRTPLRRSKPLSLAFMHSAWQSVDLDGIDTVVASSHAMAHHLAGRAAREGITAVAYVYSPPRYLWAADLDARGQGPLARAGGGLARRLDRRGLHPDVSYVAISEFVADRMRRSWGVDSRVLYPPVDTARLLSVADWSTGLDAEESAVLDGLPDRFVLGASRLVEYKRLDVAMRVGEAVDLPVVIAGSGPFEAALRAHADRVGVPVHFVGRVSDALLYTLFQRTELFVFMPIEDFGIMPVEAHALGAPLLVRDVGGTREVADLLGDGRTADPDNAGALSEAARAAVGRRTQTSSRLAHDFSNDRFRREFAVLVGS